MVYLVTGNAEERKGFINATIEKQGGNPSRATRVSLDDLSEEQSISDIVITQSGLFGDQEFFVLNDLARELPLGSLLEEYQASNNVIFFSEATVTKKILSSFEKVSAQVKEFSPEKKADTTNTFNIFSLTDALGRRDKKNLWLLYNQALQQVSVEEINGVLLWQVKNMILVAIAKGSSVEGMKPFVVTKTRGFLKNYTLEELKKLLKDLTTAFHRRDVYNTLEVQVEKIILSL